MNEMKSENCEMTHRCTNRRCAASIGATFRIEQKRGDVWLWVPTEVGLCKTCAEGSLRHLPLCWGGEFRMVGEV